ncbi:MAG: hypothetical protein JJE50_08960 [Actinomycetales bacterium]|nr:hypothetical protein [Actinomycetales bacterium]
MEPPRIPESRLDQLRNQVGSRREIWVLAAIAAILVFGGLALWSREELLEVTGIGPATLESIRPYVTL